MGNYVPYSISILVLVSLILSSCQKNSLDSEVGRQILTLISSENPQATFVFYRLDDSYPREGEVTKKELLHGYSIVSGPIDLRVEDRRALKSIIEKKKTYIEHAVPVDCFFLPGVAFRFDDKQNIIDLLVCFTCNELKYYLNGEVFWQSYFNPKELKDFVKKLYPNDAKIQSLN